MSENIKPSEVSEVLLQQLKGIDTHLQFDEVGNVLQVSDGVARIYGLRNAEANELLEFENGIMAIVMNLDGKVRPQPPKASMPTRPASRPRQRRRS